MRTAIVAAMMLLGLGSFPCSAQDTEDLLIPQDIGSYRLSRPQKHLPGERPSGGPRRENTAGALAETGHFPDPADTTAIARCRGGKDQPLPTVTVTRHAGGDSDRWLYHEIDAPFRRYGQPGNTYILKKIEGNTIITRFIAGGEYQWLSGNTVVHIEYHDMTLGKAEPLEIVKAYLAKYPATQRPITDKELISTESKTTWVRDEMERRLWLCDKWLQAVGAGNVRLSVGLRHAGESLKTFGSYRDRYFGKRSPGSDEEIDGYVEDLKATEIKAKLKEYWKWWSDNRNREINFKQQNATSTLTE